MGKRWNSFSILLNWMTKQGNFARFRGNSEGKTKLAIFNGIAKLIKDEGVLAVRTGEHVLDKIQAIEKAFKIAHDWVHQTGQGVDDEVQFIDAVKNICV